MKPLINVNFKQVVDVLIDGHNIKVEGLAYKCGVSVNIINAIHSGKTKKVEHSCGQLLLWEYKQAAGYEYE